MQGKLVSDATGIAIELDEINSMGRSPESTVRIVDSRVSRRHALIRRQDDGFWFFDLGSRNGSYLNEIRVTTAQALRDGDHLRIGGHLFVFQMSGVAGERPDQSPTEMTICDVQSKEALVLVCDIQGFTSLSEKLDPDQLAPIIGTWYAETERILTENGATLDKFIGDCALAYWLQTTSEARMAALKTVLGMQRVCDEVQRAHGDLLAAAGLQFRSGAAVHLGPVAYGGFGAQEFTLLGDAVNLAFRLEKMTRDLDARALVSGDVLRGWAEGRRLCRPLGTHPVKGRAQPVEVFALDELAAS